VKTAQWKEMGWQGEDPATDFRGAGLISLEQLLYMGRQHPHTFIRLMLKKDGTRRCSQTLPLFHATVCYR
jgi:hypothetical protein